MYLGYYDTCIHFFIVYNLYKYVSQCLQFNYYKCRKKKPIKNGDKECDKTAWIQNNIVLLNVTCMHSKVKSTAYNNSVTTSLPCKGDVLIWYTYI